MTDTQALCKTAEVPGRLAVAGKVGVGPQGPGQQGGPYFVCIEDLQGVSTCQLQLYQFLILCFNGL